MDQFMNGAAGTVSGNTAAATEPVLDTSHPFKF